MPNQRKAGVTPRTVAVPDDLRDEALRKWGGSFTSLVVWLLREYVGPTCGRCGKTATGNASINGVRYCHGDDDPEPTCYVLASHELSGTDMFHCPCAPNFGL